MVTLKKKNVLHTHLVVLLASLFFVVFVVPQTTIYKNSVTYLFLHQHPLVVYYLNRSDAQLAMEIGNYYFGGVVYDTARAKVAYTQAVTLQKNILWGHYQLARVYFVEGNYAQALTEINKELEFNPQNQRALYVRGLIEISQFNFLGAEDDFRQFVTWAPTEWGGYNDLAFVLAKEGKYAESEATIHQAMQEVPNAKDIPWLWNSLGLAQLNELHYTQAQTSFEAALVLANKITPKEWVRAYSANDPAGAEKSIQTFIEAVQKNLLIAKKSSTS